MQHLLRKLFYIQYDLYYFVKGAHFTDEVRKRHSALKSPKLPLFLTLNLLIWSSLRTTSSYGNWSCWSVSCTKFKITSRHVRYLKSSMSAILEKADNVVVYGSLFRSETNLYTASVLLRSNRLSWNRQLSYILWINLFFSKSSSWRKKLKQVLI